MQKIKTAASKDIPLIQQLAYAIWPQTYSSIISKQQIIYHAGYDIQHGGFTITNARWGLHIYYYMNPVAFASYNQTTPQTWKLNKIYILPAQQGKATGKFIIDYIIDTIKRKSIAAAGKPF